MKRIVCGLGALALCCSLGFMAIADPPEIMRTFSMEEVLAPATGEDHEGNLCRCVLKYFEAGHVEHPQHGGPGKIWLTLHDPDGPGPGIVRIYAGAYDSERYTLLFELRSKPTVSHLLKPRMTRCLVVRERDEEHAEYIEALVILTQEMQFGTSREVTERAFIFDGRLHPVELPLLVKRFRRSLNDHESFGGHGPVVGLDEDGLEFTLRIYREQGHPDLVATPDPNCCPGGGEIRGRLGVVYRKQDTEAVQDVDAHGYALRVTEFTWRKPEFVE
jgi:hypothetical protein